LGLGVLEENRDSDDDDDDDDEYMGGSLFDRIRGRRLGPARNKLVEDLSTGQPAATSKNSNTDTDDDMDDTEDESTNDASDSSPEDTDSDTDSDSEDENPGQNRCRVKNTYAYKLCSFDTCYYTIIEV
jgi:hypothetical protein